MNIQIAEALNNIAKIKKTKGDNKFAISAYQKAATLIANLSKPVSELDLKSTKGIGEKIGASITEFLTTGKIQFIEDNKDLLNTETKYVDLLRIEGIGEKTAQQIYNELHVSTIEELKIAIDTGTIKALFKDKTIDRIRKGIEYLDTTRGRIRLDEGKVLANIIETFMFPFVSKITFCGSYRRSKETIGDLDFAIVPRPEINALKEFEKMSIIDKVIDSGEKKTSVWIKGVRFDCYSFSEDLFESGIMHLTGSDEHNKQLRVIAISKGYILSQYGLYKRGPDDTRIGDRLDDGTEKGIYKLLGLEFIPPEHRDGDIMTIFSKYALGNSVETISDSDIQYDFHTHSTWSDGVNSMEDLVKTAISIGLKGIAITDHSQSLKIAKGLSIESVLAKLEEVKILRQKYPNFKILMGTEVDIHNDGTLDYPDDILDKFDIVIASIHTHMTKDTTEIYKKIIQTGKVHIIGHITGRIINERPGYEPANIEEILQECKKYGVAIELNCQPSRLDANEVLLRKCKKFGVKVAIGSDAHEKSQIGYIKTYGLSIGKRGWLTKEDLYAKAY